MKSKNELLESMAEYTVLEQMRAGTASPNLISFYISQKTKQKELELKILKEKQELLHERTEQIKSGKKDSELYEKAMEAMKRYNGNSDYYNCDNDDIDDEW